MQACNTTITSASGRFFARVLLLTGLRLLLWFPNDDIRCGAPTVLRRRAQDPVSDLHRPPQARGWVPEGEHPSDVARSGFPSPRPQGFPVIHFENPIFFLLSRLKRVSQCACKDTLASSPGVPAFFGGYACFRVAAEKAGKPGDEAIDTLQD